MWSLILRVTQIYKIMASAYERSPKKMKFSKDTLKVFKELNELYYLAYELFYSYEAKKTKEIHDGYYKTNYSGPFEGFKRHGIPPLIN